MLFSFNHKSGDLIFKVDLSRLKFQFFIFSSRIPYQWEKTAFVYFIFLNLLNFLLEFQHGHFCLIDILIDFKIMLQIRKLFQEEFSIGLWKYNSVGQLHESSRRAM